MPTICKAHIDVRTGPSPALDIKPSYFDSSSKPSGSSRQLQWHGKSSLSVEHGMHPSCHEATLDRNFLGTINRHVNPSYGMPSKPDR